MEHNYAAGRGRRKWLSIVAVAIPTVALGILVNPIFLLIGPMIFMHLFGHGSHHSGKTSESLDEHNHTQNDEGREGMPLTPLEKRNLSLP